jgi:hypothetical protein
MFDGRGQAPRGEIEQFFDVLGGTKPIIPEWGLSGRCISFLFTATIEEMDIDTIVIVLSAYKRHQADDSTTISFQSHAAV